MLSECVMPVAGQKSLRNGFNICRNNLVDCSETFGSRFKTVDKTGLFLGCISSDGCTSALYQVAFIRLTSLASSKVSRRTKQYACVAFSLPPCYSFDCNLVLVFDSFCIQMLWSSLQDCPNGEKRGILPCLRRDKLSSKNKQPKRVSRGFS